MIIQGMEGDHSWDSGCIIEMVGEHPWDGGWPSFELWSKILGIVGVATKALASSKLTGPLCYEKMGVSIHLLPTKDWVPNILINIQTKKQEKFIYLFIYLFNGEHN